MVLHKTKGIVLRTVKYGETSVIVSIFTELFGLQSYIVNGIRTTSKKGSNKASLFQPASILELVVYHNEFKNLQRLKEYKWDYLYQHIFSDVTKNAVALFMIELVTKALKQPEPNAELFYFLEDSLQHLDKASDTVTANFPLFFALHLPVFFGFRIEPTAGTEEYLDLQEGRFEKEQPSHTYILRDQDAEVVSEILKMMQPEELDQVQLNRDARRRILQGMEQYYAFNISEFGQMKTLPVLREIMS